MYFLSRKYCSDIYMCIINPELSVSPVLDPNPDITV